MSEEMKNSWNVISEIKNQPIKDRFDYVWQWMWRQCCDELQGYDVMISCMYTMKGCPWMRMWIHVIEFEVWSSHVAKVEI